MPIRNWGGGSDPSELFVSLQDQFLREAEAARDRALAAGRAASSGGGGSSGGGSSRRGSSTSASVNEGVADITERMANGQTNWRELLNYYRAELKKARKGSSLEQAIKANIANIEYVLEANGIPIPAAGAPTITAPEQAGPAWTTLAEDDLLTADVEDLINEQILYIATTENGMYPLGQNPLESIMTRTMVDATVEELFDSLISDARLYDEVLDEISSGRSAVMRDPISGATFEVTPDRVMDVIYQAYNTQYALLGMARGLGNQLPVSQNYAARRGHLATLQNKVDNIITNVVFPATTPSGDLASPNMAGVRGYMDMVFRNFNIDRNTALSSTDPYEAQSIMAASGRGLSKELKIIQEFLGSLPAGIVVTPEMQANLDYASEFANFMVVSTSNTMAPDELLAMGAELFDKRPEGFYLTSEDLEATIGSGTRGTTVPDGVREEDPGWTGIVGAAVAVQGLETNRLVREGQEGDLVTGDKFVWVTRYGESTPTAVRESDAAAWLNVEGDYHETAFPFIEKVADVNGNMQTTVVWRQMAPLSEQMDTTWWAKVGANGQPVTDRNGNQIWATMAEYESFGNSIALARQAGFMPVEMEALSGMLTVIGADGRTYYTTEEKTGLHVTMPFTTPIDIAGGFHPTDLIDSTGVMDISYTPNNGSYVGVGPGVSRREAQQMQDEAFVAEEIRLEDYIKYNAFGVPLDSPAIEETFGSLWSPMDEGMHQLAQSQSAYQEAARPRMELARRQKKIRQAEELQAQEQMLMEQSRRDSFGAQALQDNAIEAATRQTGVHFGARSRGGSFAPSSALPGTKDARDFRPEPVKPVTIDDLPDAIKPEVPEYKQQGPVGVRPI